MPVDPQRFVAAVRGVVGAAPVVPLHAPEIGELEQLRVRECLDSTYVSSVGPFVDRFEREIAAFTGSGAAVAVSNGTVALEIALRLAGVGTGDAVIVPSLSFIATANAVAHVGARPIFADSDETTLGLSPEAVRRLFDGMTRVRGRFIDPDSGRRIAAIVPMHTLGHPMRIRELLELGGEYGIPIVEDAAESLGSFVGDRHTGTFGRLGILSFNGNKILTTGGGGMILTDDFDLGRRAKHLTTTAKVPHAWEFEHDEVGFNYRMPNINAALGVAQLERLPKFLSDKRALAARYREAFADVEGVACLSEPDGTSSNYWLCAVRLAGGIETRDAVLAAANADGIQCRPFWNLLSEQAPYRTDSRGPLEGAAALHASVVCLPSSPALVSA